MLMLLEGLANYISKGFLNCFIQEHLEVKFCRVMLQKNNFAKYFQKTLIFSNSVCYQFYTY